MLFHIDIKNIEDSTVTLVITPEKKLSDKEYDKIKPIMENLGGHWREKYKAFIFPPIVLRRNPVSRWKEELQFFPTPESIVKMMISLSGLDAKNDNTEITKIARILEPSAGQSAILDIIKNEISMPYTLCAVEPDPSNIKILKNNGYNVEETTFENFYNEKLGNRSFTHILMNPPFSQGRDIKHIRMAYDLLDENGVLVSVMSENGLYYECEETKEFNNWLSENNGEIHKIPSFSFFESGTTIETVLIVLRK